MLAACSGGGDGGGGVVEPTPTGRVAVTGNRAATIDEVGSVTLQAEVRTAAGAVVPGAGVNWVALEPAVATVGADGVVRGVAPGVAHVVASAAGGTRATPDTAVVTVTPAAVARVVPADTALPAALAAGDTGTVTATLRAANDAALGPSAARTVTWTSADPAVVAVTADGRVTARAAGTTTLAATSGGVTGFLPLTVAAAPFRVQLTLDPSVTPAVAAATQAAVRRWERRVAQGSAAPLDARMAACGAYAGLAAGRFAVRVRVAPSPEGPYTGQASQDCLRTDYQGVAVTVTVDTGLAVRAAADAGAQQDVAAVVTHEIGHGLGLGAWRYQTPAPQVDAGATTFLGTRAAAAWQALGGGGFTPLQAGSVAHWSQPGGLCGELMAPVVSRGSALSAVTLGALVDLGWTVRAERTEPYTRRTC